MDTSLDRSLDHLKARVIAFKGHLAISVSSLNVSHQLQGMAIEANCTGARVKAEAAHVLKIKCWSISDQMVLVSLPLSLLRCRYVSRRIE